MFTSFFITIHTLHWFDLFFLLLSINVLLISYVFINSMDTHETTPPLLTGQLPSPSEEEEEEKQEEMAEEIEDEEKEDGK